MIGVENPSPSHLQCLEDLPLTATYSCLKLFLRWVEEGYYDYCTLPFPFKVHLSDDQQHAIEEWKGSTIPNLKEELSEVIKVLKHSQQDITSRTNAEAINVGYLVIPIMFIFIIICRSQFLIICLNMTCSKERMITSLNIFLTQLCSIIM